METGREAAKMAKGKLAQQIHPRRNGYHLSWCPVPGTWHDAASSAVAVLTLRVIYSDATLAL